MREVEHDDGMVYEFYENGNVAKITMPDGSIGEYYKNRDPKRLTYPDGTINDYSKRGKRRERYSNIGKNV